MRRSAQRGFTLLEVLVATAIMGLAVAGVMSGLATATRNAARVTQYDRAAMLARLKMDELLVDETLSMTRPLGGNYSAKEAGGVQAGWTARVMPFESLTEVPVPGTWIVQRIELQIWWMDGYTRRSFALEGFRRNIVRPEQP